MNECEKIRKGKTAIGLELGSTRIKAVLVDENAKLLASGAAEWENHLENGLWIYPLEEAVRVLQECFACLKKDVLERYGIGLETTGTLGISAMMHGIIALGENDRQLAPFLTWRNVNTGEAAARLSEALQFNMPMRWSASHLYQAALEKKAYVNEIRYLCTLSAYIHYLLSGEKAVGVGDASGMFPIDPATGDYDEERIQVYEKMLSEQGCDRKIREIFPKVLPAGAEAGTLTEQGALLLDPSGELKAGIPMVPPEGDAETGMTATNAVAVRTGNISAGTSIFSMIVLEKKLSRWYPNVDIVMTPDGKEVAMIHCNNGASELDAWMRLAKELTETLGLDIPMSDLYRNVFEKSLSAEPDAGGIVNINYLAGEHVTGIKKGHPLLTRQPESPFDLANVTRAMIYSIFATLSLGNRVLKKEGVRIDRLTGHGGLFKTKGVAERYLSAAMEAPVGVMETAGEGGAFGMAMLALYREKAKQGVKLPDYLNELFVGQEIRIATARDDEICGFHAFLESYEKALTAEKSL